MWSILLLTLQPFCLSSNRNVKTVYSEKHQLQEGRFEMMNGRLEPCVERPERAETILAHVKEAKLGEVVPPQTFGLEPILSVHSPQYLVFLETAFERWRDRHGEGDALPFAFAAQGFQSDPPRDVEGELGFYAFDAATPITAGTYRAATTAANVALTAQGLVAAGEQAAFALCRPPGHHAARELYGGYCFLNNAAIAAEAFVEARARVAVLDVDYHHGNGTQAVFYDKEVLFISLHADPAVEYPFFSGYAHQRGTGAGEGSTLNLPLPLGTVWERYREALQEARARISAFAPDVLVVSLGVDTSEDDPISRFKLGRDDFSRLGAFLGALTLPTLFVMEGGYALSTLGENVVEVLKDFEGG